MPKPANPVAQAHRPAPRPDPGLHVHALGARDSVSVDAITDRAGRARTVIATNASPHRARVVITGGSRQIALFLLPGETMERDCAGLVLPGTTLVTHITIPA